MSALAAALDLVARGLVVFPCRADKKPATPRGFKDASAEPATVRDLWSHYPGALVGVPTGAANSFDVLDIDPRHGGDLWLAEYAARLPTTRMHETRSGGRHLLFRHAAGIRGSVGKLGSGVDTRGDGGYIVWWPAAGCPVLADVPLAPWPKWLLTRLLPPAPAPNTPPRAPVADGNKQAPYALAALRNAVRVVATAPEGQRNIALNREAFALSRFIGENLLTPADIADSLAAAARHAGLDSKEIERTLVSALGARGVAL
jgi:hypothetical protein